VLGEFVKDILGISSKDKESIELVLTDKDALDSKIQTFLAEPLADEIDIEDVF